MNDELHLKRQIAEARQERTLLHKWRKIMWRYNQETGHLFDPSGAMVAVCYAGGDGGKRPEGVNNHEMQSLHNVGPLPCGNYTFDTPIEESKLGPFAIPLIPAPENEMFGRSGFFCHGDTAAMNQSASDGCIIAPHQIRSDMWNSQDHVLQVYVDEA